MVFNNVMESNPIQLQAIENLPEYPIDYRQPVDTVLRSRLIQNGVASAIFSGVVWYETYSLLRVGEIGGGLCLAFAGTLFSLSYGAITSPLHEPPV